jgi:hypothetical protein
MVFCFLIANRSLAAPRRLASLQNALLRAPKGHVKIRSKNAVERTDNRDSAPSFASFSSVNVLGC